MTQKKQLEGAGSRRGGAEHRPPGRLPSGREWSAPVTARRRSEAALAGALKETALDTADRLRFSAPDEARRLREWVNRDMATLFALLRSLPTTSGGHGRELRVGMCGVAFVAKREQAVGFARRCCKDRLCPDCSARRSRRFAAALRKAIAERTWSAGCCFAPGDDLAHSLRSWGGVCREGGAHPVPSSCSGRMVLCRGVMTKSPARCDTALPAATRIVFVTLTQRKQAWEEPKAGLDRLLVSLRRFRQCTWFKANVVGGVRSIEVTARGVGDRVGDYEVKVPGIHAHIHCLLEVRSGVDNRAIAAQWVRFADAETSGVDVQDVTPENIYQCAKYPLDMSGLLDVMSVSPDYVRRVVSALHGRRLVEALGEWRAWDLGLREAEGTLVYGDRAVYSLMSTGDEGLDERFKWADGAVEQAEDVLSSFLSGPTRPMSGLGCPSPDDFVHAQDE